MELFGQEPKCVFRSQNATLKINYVVAWLVRAEVLLKL